MRLQKTYLTSICTFWLQHLTCLESFPLTRCFRSYLSYSLLLKSTNSPVVLSSSTVTEQCTNKVPDHTSDDNKRRWIAPPVRRDLIIRTLRVEHISIIYTRRCRCKGENQGNRPLRGARNRREEQKTRGPFVVKQVQQSCCT